METSEISAGALKAIDAQTRLIGADLFKNIKKSTPTFVNRRWWDDKIMDWAMSDEALKVELFRFVDVLPMLTTPDETAKHLLEYLGKVDEGLPAFAQASLRASTSGSLGRAVLTRTARLFAADFAKRFIAGTNHREVLRAAKKQRDLNQAFTLDILGEAVTSQAEAESFLDLYCGLLRGVAPTVNQWPENPRLDNDYEGSRQGNLKGPSQISRTNLSVKLSALDCHFDAVDFAGTVRRVSEHLRTLLRLAKKNHAFINVDMESYDKKDLTLEIFKTVLLEDEFATFNNVGIVIQCYLTDSGKDLVELLDWVKTRGTPVWVRLVKGAYWDYETIRSKAEGWPIPVYQQKEQTDANYERQIRFVMKNYQHLRPAIASHNLRSIAHAIAIANYLDLPERAFEFQMLFGMGQAESKALVDRGFRVRVYMPYGELIPGMAYLVRRLLENTSNDSFLQAEHARDADIDSLLIDPQLQVAENDSITDEQKVGASELQHDSMEPETMLDTFKNIPPIDFTIESNRTAMQQAIDDLTSNLGQDYFSVLNGQPLDSGKWTTSINPADMSIALGRVSEAAEPDVMIAVKAASDAVFDWNALGAKRRAELLQDVAKQMKKRLFELSAVIVLESGKQWRDATNDVCEAIDFCEYYSRGAIDLESPRHFDVPGEVNSTTYLPRGVTGVIAPWNFPLAILTGMSAAALATGNTVVMKPAEQSPIIAAILMQMFQKAGFPDGVVQLLVGPGETIGKTLVEHPDVALVVFTGSRQVGLSINASAATQSANGLTHVKKVIAEMGGKNAIIVDGDADLDEAVLGTVHSAFGFQGQKCSACSRVIVLESNYETFVKRLVESAKSLSVGPPENPTHQMGPVIDRESQKKVQSYIDIGRQEGTLLLGDDLGDLGDLAESGCFVGPHIFGDISSDGRLAQEEVFGPVLVVMRAHDLDEALEIANGTDYALTGGIYSRSPANIQTVCKRLMVGNLYVNRNITGALVARQPFGGFKMSGIGSKAGGSEYLLQFVIPRTITENTMRRGFAPENS